MKDRSALPSFLKTYFPLCCVCAGLAFCIGVSNVVFAQDAAPKTEATAASDRDGSEEQQVVVPALGEWIRPEPTPKPEELLEGVEGEAERPDHRRDDAQEKKIFQELLKRYQSEDYQVPKTPPLVKDAVLNRKQKRRVSRLERVQSSMIRRQHRRFAVPGIQDPRGLPEVRLCTMNLQNYSSRVEVRRVMKDSKYLKTYRRKRRAIVGAIVEEACTVVAVQGVIGTSLKRAKEALDELAERVTKKSDFSWKAYVGASNHRLAFNGFLVSDFNVEVETIRNLANEELLRFGKFEEETFFRGPIELVLQVQGRGVSKKRDLVLYTWNSRKLLGGASSEAERARMQMSEALRRFVLKRSREFKSDPNPIIVLLGDRESSRFSPSSLILEGNYRLRDFRDSGPCRLEEVVTEVVEKVEAPAGGGEKPRRRKKKRKEYEYSVVCSEFSPRIKQLFGTIGEQLPQIPPYKRQEVDEEVTYLVSKKFKRAQRKNRRASRERTAEIYLFQRDLFAAYEDGNLPGRYASNVREVKYLEKKSPLLRIDLNW